MIPDRHDPESARAVTEALLLDDTSRIGCLRLLADDLRLAHEAAPDAWGVTLKESMIRLNVGRIEVLAIVRGGLHVVLDGDTPPEGRKPIAGLEHSEEGKTLYGSVPGTWSVEIPESRIAATVPVILASHRAVIRKAAATVRNPATAAAHSPGVLLYLAAILGGPLPEPAYPVPTPVRIDLLSFRHEFSRFLETVREISGEPFVSFRDGLPATWEDYKQALREEAMKHLAVATWKPSEIGQGRILERVIQAIEINKGSRQVRNNLVAWDGRRGDQSRTHRALRNARKDPAARRAFERWFFDFFRGTRSEDELFDEFLALAGRRYDLVAYLYFLKDWNRYAPIATRSFDEAFRRLGLPLVTAGQCSWENYVRFNEALLAIQRELRVQEGLSDARLIDAHSFCWMLARLKLKREPEPVVIPLPQPAGELVPVARQARYSDDKAGDAAAASVSRGEFEERDDRLRRLGRLAEDIALKAEMKRLQTLGHPAPREAVSSVADQPGRGYDLRSCELDGTPRYIEVKAARGSGRELSFILSENEWRKSRILANYFFYVVFGADSTHPDVQIIEASAVTLDCLAPVNHRATLARCQT